MTHPVFLVVVDVTKKIGYWLFIQPYLLDQLKDKAWRKKPSVPVHIPTANTITKTELLRKAVEEAREYMAALHPAALKHCLTAQRRRLESLDPRFQVNISVINDQQHYTVYAKEPVEGTIEFKGKSKAIATKVENLIGKGLPVSFGPGEIEVTGSPLFAEAFKQGGTLHWSYTLESSLSLIAADASGKKISSLDSIPGKLSGGHNECRFEGGMPGAPLSIHVTARRTGGSGPIRLGFDMRKWHGQPLLYLAFFDQISAFFEGVPDCSAIELNCLLLGNVLFSGRIQKKHLALFKGLAAFLSVLTKARAIAAKLSLNPVLNEKIDRDKAEEIDFLHQLLIQGEYRQKRPGIRLTSPIPRMGVKKLMTIPATPEGTYARQSLEDQKRSFFGQEINLGRLEEAFTFMKRVSTNNDLQKKLSKSRDKYVKVILDATSQSEHVVRRI